MKNMLLFLLCFIVVGYSSAAIAKNTLKVAVFIEPPFTDIVDGELVGENIEIAKLLAKSIDLKLVFIQCPFARCLALVKLGKADMIFGLLKLPEREQVLHYIEPAYLTQSEPLRFYTLSKHNLVIDKFSDLKNLTIGTLRGSAYFTRFDADKKIKKVELTSREQMVNMLLRDRIDAFLEREQSVLPLVSQHDYQQFTISNYTYNKMVKSYIAISRKSKIKNYADDLSAALSAAINNGEIAKIIAERHNYATPKTKTFQ